jgi:hypothetical protein
MKSFVIIFICSLFVVSLSAQVCINEFMTGNKITLQDEDLKYSDWLELKNVSSNTVSLAGWYLTDDATDLTKWQFPATNILPGAFMVIFASDKDRAVSGSELHTNFKLSGGGEYLGLIMPDGLTVVHEYAPQFPSQVDDVSYGFSGGVEELVLVRYDADCAAFVPTDDSLGDTWQDISFDDSSWTSGSLGVGYERSSGFESYFNIDLESQMYNINVTAYIRVPFVVPASDNVLSLTLRMKYDDGFVAYLNGEEVASGNAPATREWNTSATSYHDDGDALVYVDYDITSFSNYLVTGQNVLSIHGMNYRTTSSDFLISPELECVSIGSAVGGSIGYLESPTPGTENSPASLGKSETVTISMAGSLCSEPITVELFANNSAEIIYYTLDGSEPSALSAEYIAPINITTSTCLRARSFESGLALGTISSETYLFFDSSMDSFSSNIPIIVIDNFGGGDIPDLSKQAAFLAFFEPGIDGRTHMTNNFVLGSRAGIRRRGESSLRATTSKPNLAVESWSQEADDDCNISPLGLPAESDWILWAPYSFDRCGIRNAFIYNLSNQSGNYAVRTRFVEVFLNAYGGDVTMDDYAGMYLLMEKIKRDNNRVDVESLTVLDNDEPAITGGYILRIDKSDPEENLLSGMRQGSLYCRTPSLEDITVEQEDYISQYIIDFEAQLGNSDPATGYPAYIEEDSFIDHNMLNMLAKNVDALRISTYMSKPRNGKLSMGPIWDFDRSQESSDGRDNDPETWSGTGDGTLYFERIWWVELFANIDFWQKYVDRWQELRNDVFSDSNIAATIDGMAAEVAEARARDIAKWRQNPRYGYNGLDGTQQGEINYLKWWLLTRMAWVDSQFPEVPILSQIGEQVVDLEPLTITAPVGTTIYYTLDGTDPKAVGGIPSATALVYTSEIYVEPGARIVARAWDGTTWSGTAPSNAPPWSAISTVKFAYRSSSMWPTEINYNPKKTAYGSLFDNDDFEFLEFVNIGPGILELDGYVLSGGVDFDFSTSAVENVPAGEYIVIVRNLEAFCSRYSTNGMFIAGEYSGKLSNSGEKIQLDHNGEKVFEILYSDESGWPVTANGVGHTLVPYLDAIDSQGFDVLDYPGNWSASSYIGGSPGEADPDVSLTLVINEVTAHTDTGEEEPFDSNDWIELYNPTKSAITLDEFWYLSDDEELEKYNIPAGIIIQAGGFAVFSEDDFHADRISGFGLDKAGEQVFLSYKPGMGLDRVVDCFEFEGQLNGASVGKYPDGDVYVQTLTPTLGDSNQLPTRSVYIQELMYNPAAVDGTDECYALEYIMLTNASSSAVMFEGEDLTNTWRFSGGVDYSFEEGVSLVSGDSIWVVSFDPQVDLTNRTLFCSTYNLDSSSVRLIGPYSGHLSDSGEHLTLVCPQAPDDVLDDISWVVIDEICWFDEIPWTPLADGTGLALLRIGQSGNDPLSWTTGKLLVNNGVQVLSEKLTPGIGDWDGFLSITNLVNDDYADWQSGNGVTAAVVAGVLAPGANPLSRLSRIMDGYAQADSNNLRTSICFTENTTGRLQVDLQKIVPVLGVSTFSWHESDHQNQYYDLYYSTETVAPDSDASISNVVLAGWEFLATVETTYDESSVGQVGVNVNSRFGGILVNARHLLFEIKNSCYYGELDVFVNGSFVTNGIPTAWLDYYGLLQNDAAAMADSDNDGVPNWQEYRAGTSPANNKSVFKITGLIDPPVGTIHTLSWNAVAGKRYTVKYKSDLKDTTWTTLVSNIHGVEPLCSIDIEIEGSCGFISIEVE